MSSFLPYNPRLLSKARDLRKNMPYSEVLLWKRLQGGQLMGYDFDRQKPILEYIVDFFCKDAMLAIEVDGITHLDDGKYADYRQASIEKLGVSFLRFDALEVVKNPDAAADSIARWLVAFEEDHGVPPAVLNRRQKF
jgi:very-short-patch-repair endonuclease